MDMFPAGTIDPWRGIKKREGVAGKMKKSIEHVIKGDGLITNLDQAMYIALHASIQCKETEFHVLVEEGREDSYIVVSEIGITCDLEEQILMGDMDGMYVYINGLRKEYNDSGNLV